MELSTYKAMLNNAGNSRRQRIINKSKLDVKKTLINNPSYKEVTIDGVSRYVAINSATITNQKIINALPDESFEIGQLLVWNQSHWLIIERDLENEVSVRGKIKLCNRQIIWQNKTTGNIVSEWATVDKPYFSNLDEDKTMAISSRQFSIQMPYTDESKFIDVGKRFMLEVIGGEPKTYKVTCVDTITERFDRDNSQIGFLSITIEQDQYNKDTDNAELMICDYFNPQPVGSVYEIKYSGAMKIGSSKKVVSLYKDGELCSCDWSVSDNAAVHIISESTGNKCTLSIDNDVSAIGSAFIVYAKIDDTTVTSIECEVVGQ